jgi:hypothetical protein
MPGLPPPRHIPTLPYSTVPIRNPQGPLRGQERPSFGGLTKFEIALDPDPTAHHHQAPWIRIQLLINQAPWIRIQPGRDPPFVPANRAQRR